MKNLKVLAILFGISLGLASLSTQTMAQSLGSIIGGIIDCPLSGKPCSSDANSNQKERCKISVGATMTPRGLAPVVTCSE